MSVQNTVSYEKQLIQTERDQKVVRSVNLIQNAQYTLSLEEQRFLLYCISKDKPDDSEQQTYTIALRDYLSVCGLSQKTSYANMKQNIITTLQKMILAIEYSDPDGKTKFMVTNWFDHITLTKEDGLAEFQFSSTVSKELIGLARYNQKVDDANKLYYISDELKYMLPFRCRYSFYLYPLLRSYQNRHEWTFTLEELRELAKTAGYPVVGTATQKLQSPVAATFMGSGRLLELKDYMEAAEADIIIFDEELSPAQLRNIEELCDCPVLDRTMLILDIFAARAVSGEGKLQVELARLQYQLPRLAGRGVQLSRQGGGGTGGTGARRGAGESKLEVDRRHIRRRIDALKTELTALARRREQRRTRRKKDGITTVAIVGYTNVGKSTLLNTLTEAGVLAEDKLFATLDPTSRALALPDGRSVMLIDTVGLVRRLPHQLVEAFHSTLEEAANADLILSVCDITSPELLEQRAVTERLLEELGVEGTPVITVLNKCDAAPDARSEPYKGCVRISAKTGYGLPQLLQAIAEALPPQRIRCRLCLPYTEGALLHRLEQQGQIFRREYTAEGTLLDAEVEQRDWRLYESYLKTED